MRRSTRLFSAFTLILISLSMMVFVSYAWFTLSTAPAINGIKVAISGDNTIMIAPNLTMNLDDGTVANYPGFFTKTADLEPEEGALLSPVSTADGVNWFIPVGEDDEMKVSSLEDFVLETDYSSANSSDGGYAYIDFWVVSPLSGTVLRICSGDSMDVQNPAIGSYVVQLPESVKNFTNSTGYNLDDSYQSLASSIRVGFLVDDAKVTSDAVMTAYVDSALYDPTYKSIKGVYSQESETTFMIYEPNALIHPNKGVSNVLTEKGIETYLCQTGEYCATYPIGLDDEGNRVFSIVQDKLIVQGNTPWKRLNQALVLDDMYQAYVAIAKENGKPFSLDDFYKNYMHENYLQYVDYKYDGLFFEDSWDLLNYGDLRVTDSDAMTILERTNAVQDSYIVLLEKNVPQRIRMFVWIEGQDVDCSSSAAGQSISIRLELSGSTGA